MSWRHDAACRGMDVDLFFPDTKDWRAFEAAKAVCGGCPVRDDCLIENIHEIDGVFGGTTRKERKHLRLSLGIDPLRQPEAKHGTESRYRHHGCQCQPCIAAHRLAVAKRAERAARWACA